MDTKTSEAIGIVRNDIRRVELSLRGEINRLREDLQHHFDISAGCLRQSIRTIEEDLTALDAKIERLWPSSDPP